MNIFSYANMSEIRNNFELAEKSTRTGVGFFYYAVHTPFGKSLPAGSIRDISVFVLKIKVQ